VYGTARSHSQRPPGGAPALIRSGASHGLSSPAAALQGATAAAAGRDVLLGGGVSTVHEYLRAGLLDELHVAVVPVLLGGGERALRGAGHLVHDWQCVAFTPSATVTHVRLRRR
jgi:dihydrofolate reductase